MAVRRIAPYFSERTLDEVRRDFEDGPYVEKPYEVGLVTEDHPEQWLADLARRAKNRSTRRWGADPSHWYFALWHVEPTFRPYEGKPRVARS